MLQFIALELNQFHKIDEVVRYTKSFDPDSYWLTLDGVNKNSALLINTSYTVN